MAAKLALAKQMPVGRTSVVLKRSGWVRPSRTLDATGIFRGFHTALTAFTHKAGGMADDLTPIMRRYHGEHTPPCHPCLG
jgi:hypothetical protein